MLIKGIKDIDVNEWAQFVDNHKDGNIFQTPQMYQVFLKTKFHFPFINFAVEDKKIIGVLLSTRINDLGLSLGNYLSRTVALGGPLIDSSNNQKKAISLLLSEQKKIVGKMSLYIQIRNLFSQDLDNSAFFNQNYTYNDHVNYIINLSKSTEFLWKKISKNRRKGISRAIRRKELEFYEINSIDEIPEIYELIKKTYKRVKIPVAHISLFYNIFKDLVPIGYSKFLAVKFKNKIVACRIILNYKKTIYDYYAGYDISFSNKYPNEYLVWKILEWGHKKKFSYFDFGGGGNPNKYYGPREFKRRFGGKLVSYGRFVFSSNYLTHNLFKYASQVKEKI